MSKFLVTGAAGFIGSHLVDLLLEDGVEGERLRLLIPPWEKLQNLPQQNFDIAIADIRDKKAVGRAMKDVTVVYHLAAQTVVDGGTYNYYKDINIEGTRNLLEAAAKNSVRKFIYFSSISVYGLPAWKGNMENFSEASPKLPSEPYGQTKLKAEELVVEAAQKWGLPYIIIRPTTVYGPRDKAGIFQLFKAIQKNVFFFIGNARNKMDYVYVKDLVKITRLAEKKKIENEDFIIGAGKPVTQQYLVECIASSLGKKTPKIHIHKLLALVLAYGVKWSSRLFNLRPLLFPERVKVLTTDCYFNMSKASKLISSTSHTSLKEGMYLTSRSLY